MDFIFDAIYQIPHQSDPPVYSVRCRIVFRHSAATNAEAVELENAFNDAILNGHSVLKRTDHKCLDNMTAEKREAEINRAEAFAKENPARLKVEEYYQQAPGKTIKWLDLARALRKGENIHANAGPAFSVPVMVKDDHNNVIPAGEFKHRIYLIHQNTEPVFWEREIVR
ncbi:MAG: hypothetical protein V4543_14710 [Bacteroidota bacterium]